MPPIQWARLRQQLSSIATISRRGWFGESPRLLRLLLDGVVIACVVGSITRIADLDTMFHTAFVAIVIEVFAFGVVTAARLVVLTLVATAFDVVVLGSGLELDEVHQQWPSTALVALTILLLTHAQYRTTQRYGRLYRQARERMAATLDAERRRTGMDLHDGVGQLLSAQVLTLSHAVGALPARHPLRAEILRSIDLAGQAIDENRAIAARLGTAVVQHEGLVESLRRLAANAGLEVTVEIAPEIDEVEMAPERLMGIYRIAQEAIGNVARHSGAHRASLQIRRQEGDIVVEVRDDGVGYETDEPERAGLGLVGMRDRADRMGGTVRIASQPGRGTTVTLQVPLTGHLRLP